ncbi:ubiquinol-cytochrome C chaperone family protein [Pelagibacteraceae bacterium]|nr:ubiquinol-cytochrome C chaperone family protein [Pelagibacteraceae bacterium]
MFKSKNTSTVKDVYQSIIDNSRSKIFYINLDVDDSFESRFDLVILHSFIIFQYFIEINDKKNQLSQSLFDFMFHDFENNLREMGFGDIAVNKRMKKFISAFYGRILSYSNSYAEYKKNESLLNFSLAIRKNIYKNKKISEEKVNLISNYVISNITLFLTNDYETNINMKFKFQKFTEV